MPLIESAVVVTPVNAALVPVRFVANKFVLVACVMVAVGANSPPIAERSPEKKPVPPTAKVPDGVVVPIPKFPPPVMTEERAPVLL